MQVQPPQPQLQPNLPGMAPETTEAEPEPAKEPTGSKQKVYIRRRPIPKVHSFSVEDSVTVELKKNDDFKKDDLVAITGFSDRNPNFVQVKNADGKETFISHHELDMDQEKIDALRAKGHPLAPPDKLKNTHYSKSYLEWP